MVILPRRGFNSRIQRLLHDRTADSIANAVMHVPRTAATIIPYRMAQRALSDLATDHEVLSDEVTRGALREDSHLEADEQLAERASNADTVPIGELKFRDVVTVAGRVRSMTLSGDGNKQLRCVVADATGSISLVFQGRSMIPGIERGTRLLITGTVQSHDREAVIMNPTYEIVAGPATDE